MNCQKALRLLASIASCAIFGCQPSQGVSSTADKSDREVAQSPDSDEAALSTVSKPKRSKKPSQETGAGRSVPAADASPSIETELPSGSPPATAADEGAQTEVRETFYPDGSTPRRQWLVKVLPDGTEVDHGESLQWHDNGQLWLQGEYDDGLREGRLLSWWPNGERRGEGWLHRNRRVGTWIIRYENGQKRSEAAYEMGLRHGRSTAWDEDGNITATGEYVRKKKHGTWITYVDGKKTETEWVNGVKVE